MVGGAHQGAGVLQAMGQSVELVERVDLPREVVQPDLFAPGGGRPGGVADLEQSDVMVVRGPGCLEKRSTAQLTPDAQHPKAEDLGVEGNAALDVADVQHGVVEASDGHR